ncbi:MAG TPA: RHS repeat-associated core domain-containing protein [Anaerolineales bacterium]|nr:RHS repeat-associated core domain-containing protein [Anaerolineales bacterium]
MPSPLFHSHYDGYGGGGVSRPKTTEGWVSYAYSDTAHKRAVTHLGGVYHVDKVVVWHYAADGRTYHNTKTQVSADGTNWTTVYDSAVSGEYPETAAGKTHSFSLRNVRYVRDWVNGSTSNVGNHWVEIQVWGQRSVTYIGNYLEWTGATNTMKKYYYAGATRVAMREGSSVYYLLGDHLGSTSVVTDPGGVILSATRYDPWGELRAVSGPSQTSYGYTGQRAEKGLGLYFYGARFYDPQLSRFLSADSIIPQQQGVQAWDRFAYVNNNPLKYTDPSGHAMTQCGLDGQDCGASASQVAYETKQYYYENCSNGYGGGCPTVELIGENQAMGARLDLTIGSFDNNLDILYFGSSHEWGVFWTPGAQEGNVGMASTVGLLFARNMQGRASYRGPSMVVAGTDAPTIPLGINIESDFSIGLPNSDGSIPETLYIGSAPLQPEVGIYTGAGYTFDVTNITRPKQLFADNLGGFWEQIKWIIE